MNKAKIVMRSVIGTYLSLFFRKNKAIFNLTDTIEDNNGCKGRIIFRAKGIKGTDSVTINWANKPFADNDFKANTCVKLNKQNPL